MDLDGIMLTLSEISQTENDKYCTISLTCGMENRTKPDALDTGNRLGVGGWAKWVKVAERNKLSVIKSVSCAGVMYSMVLTFNNSVLCPGKLLRIDRKRSHHKKKNCN